MSVTSTAGAGTIDAWSRTVHQAARATAVAATTATTARCTGPSCSPPIRNRRDACRPGTGSTTGTGGSSGRSRTRVWVDVSHSLSDGPPRTAASSALSVASRRDTASACSDEDWDRRIRPR